MGEAGRLRGKKGKAKREAPVDPRAHLQPVEDIVAEAEAAGIIIVPLPDGPVDVERWGFRHLGHVMNADGSQGAEVHQALDLAPSAEQEAEFMASEPQHPTQVLARHTVHPVTGLPLRLSSPVEPEAADGFDNRPYPDPE